MRLSVEHMGATGPYPFLSTQFRAVEGRCRLVMAKDKRRDWIEANL